MTGTEVKLQDLSEQVFIPPLQKYESDLAPFKEPQIHNHFVWIVMQTKWGTHSVRKETAVPKAVRLLPAVTFITGSQKTRTVHPPSRIYSLDLPAFARFTACKARCHVRSL